MGTQAGVHQPRHSIKRLAMVRLAGPTPTGEGMERRLIELATHYHPGPASISSMFIREKRQRGGSDGEKGG